MHVPFSSPFGIGGPAPRRTTSLARLWICVLAIATIDMLWLAATPLRLAWSSYPFLAKVGCFLLPAIWLGARLSRESRLRALLNGIAFLLAAWPALRLLNHLTMTLHFPFADATLARMDSAIGFDWYAYLHWVDAQPLLLHAMAFTYANLTGYSCLLFVFLTFGREPQRRSLEMLSLFLATALACTLIGALFPALAAMAHYAVPPGTFHHFGPGTGTYHLATLTALRSDPAHAFDLGNMPELVTFPSFHTAMGIVAIYCARGTPWLLVPMAIINVLMIASTPVFGSHYGIDVVAGAAVASATILLMRRGRSHGFANAVRRQSPVPQPVLEPASGEIPAA